MVAGGEGGRHSGGIMKRMRCHAMLVGACVLLVGVPVRAEGMTQDVPPARIAQAEGAPRAPDVIFVPTPQRVINAMLKLASVSKTDVVYDLGCGDGRIVVSAAKLGARSVGIDIDPDRIREANSRIQTAGVGKRAKVIQGDLFETDVSEASVVTLYLLSSLNLKLRPKLLSELRPGTRIVSHGFDMGDWKPEKSLDVAGSTIYLWRVPAKSQ
jgi:SAM-dependent methyltransferase